MAKVRYTADATQVVKAANDYANAQKKVTSGLDATAKSYGLADREGRKFLKSVETQQGKYNRLLSQTAELQKRGVIDQRQAAQAATSLREKYERLDPSIRAAAEGQQRLTEMGKRITTELERPIERYKRKLLELGKAYRSGAISQQTFVRGAKQLKGELTGVAQKEREAGSAADELRRKALAIVRDNEQPLERFKRKNKELILLYRKGALTLDQQQRAASRLRKELRKAGGAGDAAFGDSALTKMSAYASGILGIAAGLGGIKNIMDQIQQQQEAAAERVVSSLSGFGELSQISKTEEIFQRRKDLANKVIGRGITKDEGQAATIGFQLDSADLNKKATELFLRIGEQKFVKPEDLGALALATTTAQTAIGIKETGSRRDLINKAVEAAAHAPGNATQILTGVSKFGTSLGELGYTDEAGLAALEIASTARGSIKEGSTLVTAGLKAIENSEISKGSFIETIEAINHRRSLGEKVKDILNTQDNEAITGIRVLGNNIDKFKQYKKDIDAAQKDDPLAKRLGFLENDPVLGPALQAAKAAGKNQLAQNIHLSPDQNLIKSIKDEHSARLINERSPAYATMNNIFTDASDLFGFDQRILNDGLHDKRLPTELRLKIAKRLRETADESAGVFASPSTIDITKANHDKSIQILEAQLGVAQEMRDLARDKGTEQKPRPVVVTGRAQ